MQRYDTPWPLIVLNASGHTHPPCATVDNVLRGGRLPYHVIVSLGMLRSWVEKSDIGVEAHWWNVFAVLLEHALNRWANNPTIRSQNGEVLTRVIAAEMVSMSRKLAYYLAQCSIAEADYILFETIPDSVIKKMLITAVNAGVCSLDQTVLAAIDYLSRQRGMALLKHSRQVLGIRVASRDIHKVELTTFREGHTSSVLRVAVYHRFAEAPALFGLNVARDLADASRDLRKNQINLQQWANMDRESVVDVYGVGDGCFTWFSEKRRAMMLAVRWFEDAKELHVVPVPGATWRGRFVAVNDFRQRASFVPEIAGEVLSDEISDHLWARIVILRSRLAQIDQQAEIMRVPLLELNHGDAVVKMSDDKFKIGIVACSSDCWQGPIWAWPYEAALSSARDDNNPSQRLYWGKPTKAIKAMYRALKETQIGQNLADGQSLADRMIAAAKTVSMNDVVAKLNVHNDNMRALNLLEETRRALDSFTFF